MKIVSIGGYGHSVCVFDEIIQIEEANLIAFAPAFAGEDTSIISSHNIIDGNVKYYDDYIDMLEKEKPDVAIVSTRLDKIAGTAIEAANRGCHLICEKPLALNKNKLFDVFDAVKKNNVKLTAMLTMRSEPEFIAAKKIYESGEIGEAVLINGRKSYKWGAERPEWFGDKKKYGGTINWVGIHALDFINFITGLSFVKTTAMTGNFSHPERPACDDNCALALELSNGGHATISVDFLRPNSAETHGDDWIRIVGTKGVVEARTSDHSCDVISNETGMRQVSLPKKEFAFWDFFQAVAGDKTIAVPQKESFLLTYACLCSQESADKNILVSIDNSLFA